MEDVARIADRVIVMRGGRVTLEGDTREVYSHRAELDEMGLAVPSVTRVMAALKLRGADVPDNILTVAEARDAVLRLRKGGER